MPTDAGFPAGLWTAHSYDSAAAVTDGGMADGALWILSESGSPVEAGIWPQVPGGSGGSFGEGTKWIGDPTYWLFGRISSAEIIPVVFETVNLGDPKDWVLTTVLGGPHVDIDFAEIVVFLGATPPP